MNGILITGADGYLGRSIASWLLDHSDCRLTLWIRAREPGTISVRREALARDLGTDRFRSRCRIVTGDLRQAQPFSGIDPKAIEGIIHCAAVTDFGVTGQLADAVNLEGCRRLLHWARDCQSLYCLALLSTLYVDGLADGTLHELPVHAPGIFANHYERSKWRAEDLLVSEFADLPWQIHRVATVIAADASGRVIQYNVVHNTLKLLYYGLLAVIPGAPATRINLTTGAFAAEACSRLLLHGGCRQVYHISDDGSEALTLGALLGRVYDVYQQDRHFRQLGVLRPMFCDYRSFTGLQQGAGDFSEVIGQALDSIAPFARQLYRDRAVATVKTRAALPGWAPPSGDQVLAPMCRHLIASRWGRAQEYQP